MAAAAQPRAAHRPPRAPRAHRRARARDRQLLLVLALVDVLVDGRADDLPAGVRLRLRLARQQDRRLRLRRVRRHGNRRDGGAVLERLPGDVRDVRQVPVPAHLRRDPRGAGRHRGARHRRGAVDRHARRRLRLRAAARRDGLRPRPVVGDAHRAVHRVRRRLRLGVLRDRGRRLRRSRSRTSATSSAPCSRRSSSSRARSSRSTSCRSGRRSSATSTRCYHCVELVRHAAFGWEGWTDLPRLGASSSSACSCGASRSTR